jgi:hypothetical protein
MCSIIMMKTGFHFMLNWQLLNVTWAVKSCKWNKVRLQLFITGTLNWHKLIFVQLSLNVLILWSLYWSLWTASSGTKRYQNVSSEWTALKQRNYYAVIYFNFVMKSETKIFYFPKSHFFKCTPKLAKYMNICHSKFSTAKNYAHVAKNGNSCYVIVFTGLGK